MGDVLAVSDDLYTDEDGWLRDRRVSNFADELEREVRAAAEDMRRQLNTYYAIPPGALPSVPWHRRVWRRLRYKTTEATNPTRRWLAKRIYDFDVHEDRW